tara:strand:+ start:3356 stop:4735 length:1380 start_codon:yes stop_codon:yes gene_type:complete
MFRKVNKVHFVGIGGIGMSGIAELLLNQGFDVSGSDLNDSELIDKLRSSGAKINIGHKSDNLLKSEAVVYSSAIPEDNVELIFAREKNIPTIKRAEMLGELIALKNTSIAVGGTHGKTSTSSMIGTMLSHSKLDPTLIVGGLVKNLNSNSKLGAGEIVVVEADEYDKSFLQLKPTVAVITNIEEEHMDCYSDMDDLYDSFISFANSVPFYGSVVICSDSSGASDIINKIKRPITTYGINSNADIQASMISFNEMKSFYTLNYRGENLGQVNLSAPGEHNILNSLASAAIGVELGIDPKDIISGLNAYQGVRRRFEIKGTINDIIIIDDYAHHPTEVEATLNTAKKSWDKRIIGVFQPHLFSRTKDFYKEFAEAMMGCDIALITDIYPAREKPITGVTGKLVYDRIKELGHKNSHYIPDLSNINTIIEENVEAGDLIITMGAGTIWRYGESILKHLSQKK